MTDSLLLKASPREETLQFLRAFARYYQPTEEATDFSGEQLFGSQAAIC